MAVWKFQLVPAQRDLLAVGFRMDAVGQAFEKTVNDALRYPFKFHKINKLVLELGATEPPKKDYIEALGVATKRCPHFNLERYKALPDAERVEALKYQTIQVFEWLQATYSDAQFVDVGLRNLGWANSRLQ